MQNFRAKPYAFVVVFKAKAIYNSFKLLNKAFLIEVLVVISHSTQQNSVSQYCYQSCCNYFLKMGHMYKEQALCEQSTLSDLRKWSAAALRTFNNYTIIMTNNGDSIIIS